MGLVLNLEAGIHPSAAFLIYICYLRFQLPLPDTSDLLEFCITQGFAEMLLHFFHLSAFVAVEKLEYLKFVLQSARRP